MSAIKGKVDREICSMCDVAYAEAESEVDGTVPRGQQCSRARSLACKDLNLDPARQCAPMQPVDSLSQLKKVHQNLLEILKSQEKEKDRILKEINEATDQAFCALKRRRDVLVEEVLCMEKHFPVEVSLETLETGIQQAKQWKSIPSSENHCDMEMADGYILEKNEPFLAVPRTPVDVHALDLSGLVPGSGLRCRLEMDDFVKCLKACLKITSQNSNIEEESPAVHVLHRGAYEKTRKFKPAAQELQHNSDQPDGKAGSIFRQEVKQENQKTGTPRGSSPSPSDSVVIEEFVEESESVLPHSTKKKPFKETRKMGKRVKKMAAANLAIHQGNVLQDWVFVVHIVNPNHFYVRRVAERRAAVLLSKKINTFCSGEGGIFVENDVLETGSTVFVRWKENMWYRAVLKEIFESEQDRPVTKCSAHAVSRVHVFFQDYGFSQQVSVHQGSDTDPVHRLNQCLRKPDLVVQSELRSWVPQAIRCSLKGIVPADPMKGWNEEAQAVFHQVVGTKVVKMQVLGHVNDTLLVDLKNAPMDKGANDMPLSLREHLVFLELARFCSPVAQHSRVDSCAESPLRFNPPKIPKARVQFSAVVCHINTPSDFYIQMVDNTDFLWLNTKLQEYYSQESPMEQDLEVLSPVINQPCVALFDDEVWYRAEIIGLPGDRQVEVRYVDFGNEKTLPLNDVRKIKDEFLPLPAMAIRCSLADVEPFRTTDGWSKEYKERFHDLVGEQLICAVVTVIPEGNPTQQILPVRLFEFNHIGELLRDIGELLVSEGLASSSMGVQLDEERQSPEATVWDPPIENLLEEMGADVAEDVADYGLSSDLQLGATDLSVRVTHVTSPASFFVQLLQKDSHLKRLCKILKEEYALSKLVPVEWKPQMYCAVYIDGIWERGQICSLPSNSTAEVLRCDFGGKVRVHLNNLRPLRHHLTGCFVLECSLCDVRPAGGGTTWTATACEFISCYLTGTLATITTKANMSQQPVPVTLYCSHPGGQEVNFADLMLSAGLALKERRTNPEEPVQQGKLQEIVKMVHYAPPTLPPCGPIQMTITAVGEHGVIYAMTQEAEKLFEELKKSLKHLKLMSMEKPSNWKCKQGCAVMGSDMLWYRAEVLEDLGWLVKVRYVDQGLVENIPVFHIYPMLLSEDVPQLSVPCQLHGVMPVGGVWQSDAVALLKELLHSRSVNVYIKELPLDPRGRLTVQIMLDGMDLRRIMVHHQHAVMSPTVSDYKEHMPPSLTELDDWDWDTSGLEETELKLERYSSPRLPEKGKSFPVQIRHLCAPDEVFLCPLLHTDEFVEDGGNSLEEALKYVNENVESLSPLTDFPIENPCLAKYSDGLYYRAKILSIESCYPVQILVRHVDFGSDDTLSTQRLRTIPSELMKFPCKAIKVRVAGFKPPRVGLEKESEWSAEAVLEMIDLLHNDISATILSTEAEITVALYNDMGALVHLPLIEKRLAVEDWA